MSLNYPAASNAAPVTFATTSAGLALSALRDNNVAINYPTRYADERRVSRSLVLAGFEVTATPLDPQLQLLPQSVTTTAATNVVGHTTAATTSLGSAKNATLVAGNKTEEYFEVNIAGEYPFDHAKVLFGFLMPFVVIISLVTNFLVVMVLTRHRMHSPTNLVLCVMACVDMLTLLTGSPWYFYIYTLGHYKDFMFSEVSCRAHHIMIDVLPVFFHTASIWLTLLLAGQRYIYVCHPTLANTWITMPRIKKWISIILVIAFLSQLARFFDNNFKSVIPTSSEAVGQGPQVNLTNLNSSSDASSPDKKAYTCIRKTADWVVWLSADLYFGCYFVFRIVFVYIIPCTLLITINCLLYHALKRAETKRTELFSTRLRPIGPNSINKNSHNAKLQMNTASTNDAHSPPAQSVQSGPCGRLKSFSLASSTGSTSGAACSSNSTSGPTCSSNSTSAATYCSSSTYAGCSGPIATPRTHITETTTTESSGDALIARPLNAGCLQQPVSKVKKKRKKMQAPDLNANEQEKPSEGAGSGAGSCKTACSPNNQVILLVKLDKSEQLARRALVCSEGCVDYLRFPNELTCGQEDRSCSLSLQLANEAAATKCELEHRPHSKLALDADCTHRGTLARSGSIDSRMVCGCKRTQSSLAPEPLGQTNNCPWESSQCQSIELPPLDTHKSEGERMEAFKTNCDEQKLQIRAQKMIDIDSEHDYEGKANCNLLSSKRNHATVRSKSEQLQLKRVDGSKQLEAVSSRLSVTIPESSSHFDGSSQLRGSFRTKLRTSFGDKCATTGARRKDSHRDRLRSGQSEISTGKRSTTSSSKSSLDSNRTTWMLIVVVSVFLLVELPSAVGTILHVLSSIFNIMVDESSQLSLEYMKLYSNFFIMVSYSLNFSIYCSMSHKFRKTFREIFICKWMPGAGSERNSASAIDRNSDKRGLASQLQHKSSIIRRTANTTNSTSSPSSTTTTAARFSNWASWAPSPRSEPIRATCSSGADFKISAKDQPG